MLTTEGLRIPVYTTQLYLGDFVTNIIIHTTIKYYQPYHPLIRYILLVPMTEGLGIPVFTTQLYFVTNILIYTIIKYYKQISTIEALPGNTSQQTIP